MMKTKEGFAPLGRQSLETHSQLPKASQPEHHVQLITGRLAAGWWGVMSRCARRCELSSRNLMLICTLLLLYELLFLATGGDPKPFLGRVLHYSRQCHCQYCRKRAHRCRIRSGAVICWWTVGVSYQHRPLLHVAADPGQSGLLRVRRRFQNLCCDPAGTYRILTLLPC
ncbi:hypothetical protein F5Y18DRAFT_106961 [Xylariaceae sp. FL1019]|nr:hypothetical protein F5Y18DRAFT_106961 [Xylariaceae sp. FL1019]